MPVIAIGAAAAAWGLGGAAAIGGVLAGTATLATTLTAVATIGATLGAVGAVTHDKTLSTVGMVMGAVGGIGALAANAGLFGASATTESLFGSAASEVAAPDIAGSVAASNDLSGLAALPELPGEMSPAMTAAGQAAESNIVNASGALDMQSFLPTDSILSATDKAAGSADSLINSGGSGGIKTLVSDNVDEATNQLKGIGGGSLPGGSPTDGSVINGKGGVTPAGGSAAELGLPTKGQYVGQTATSADGTEVTWNGASWAKADGGFFSGIMKSPMAQYGMVQAAGSFLSGSFDTLKPAQVDALNAQAEANRASASINKQQATNMGGAFPVATRSAPGSLINNAPAVTGKVAV